MALSQIRTKPDEPQTKPDEPRIKPDEPQTKPDESRTNPGEQKVKLTISDSNSPDQTQSDSTTPRFLYSNTKVLHSSVIETNTPLLYQLFCDLRTHITNVTSIIKLISAAIKWSVMSSDGIPLSSRVTRSTSDRIVPWELCFSLTQWGCILQGRHWWCN